MQFRDLAHKIKTAFEKSTISISEDSKFSFIQVQKADLLEVLKFCTSDTALRFDYLECLTGSDLGQDLQVLYQLFSTSLVHHLNIKVSLDRHTPSLPSVCQIWRAAFYYELEAAEMFGLNFEGHPRPGKLLLPEDWPGHPLRKDYVYPEEYHSIEHRREPLRKEHVRP